MSALPPKADITERDPHVRFVPKADILRCSIQSLRRRTLTKFVVVLEPQKLSEDEQRRLHEELAKAMMAVQ
jgi:anion-transporting  ArsA/GET3 family ATPase